MSPVISVSLDRHAEPWRVLQMIIGDDQRIDSQLRRFGHIKIGLLWWQALVKPFVPLGLCISHGLSMVGLRPSSYWVCGTIDERLSHWVRTGWQSVISQRKIPCNTPPRPGIEPGPDSDIYSFSHWAIMTRTTERTARQWDTFILLLSHHDPGNREDRQWDTFIFPLSYHDWLLVIRTWIIFVKTGYSKLKGNIWVLRKSRMQ